MHQVKNQDGSLVTTITGPLKVEFTLEDFRQLVAGACVMALPVALTEETMESQFATIELDGEAPWLETIIGTVV